MFARQILHSNRNHISINTSFKKLASLKFIKIPNIRYYYNGISPGRVMGYEYLQNARLNKGLAFTLQERQNLGIHGLQAPRIKTQDEQLDICKLFVNRFRDPINKYLYLSDLHDRNERLFFRLLSDNLEKYLPIVYTPTVGQVCQKFGIIYRRPRGLFITSNDRGHILSILKNWPERDVRAIVVTDGERILGLGDLGAFGMGIPVGKLSLYTALAGIQPHHCLPIQLDCGTNNPELLNDPFYIGLRQNRLTGKEYEAFIDEFMAAVVKRYGQNTLIQFEDFGNRNAFNLLDKYRNKYCAFNDDIQGTGAVAVGGLYASRKLTGKGLVDHTYLFAGAGAAATGIANLCVAAMHSEGISIEEARSKIYMFDIDGLLTNDRYDNLDPPQKWFTKDIPNSKNLLEVVQKINPSVLIGATATKGLFTPEILKYMATKNHYSIIFAISNPPNKAECTADEAFEHTDGRVIFASGTLFPPVNFKGEIYRPGQCNNAYGFPGIALGITATQSYHIPDEIFLIAAQELGNSVTNQDLELGSVFPSLKRIREVSLRIAVAIAEYAYCNKLASIYPEPKDKYIWLKNQLYDFNYNTAIPETWKWPVPQYIPNKKRKRGNI